MTNGTQIWPTPIHNTNLGVDAVDVAGAEPGELAEDVVGEDVHPEEARQHGELHQEPADFAQHAVVILTILTEMIIIVRGFG